MVTTFQQPHCSTVIKFSAPWAFSDPDSYETTNDSAFCQVWETSELSSSAWGKITTTVMSPVFECSITENLSC